MDHAAPCPGCFSTWPSSAVHAESMPPPLQSFAPGEDSPPPASDFCIFEAVPVLPVLRVPMTACCRTLLSAAVGRIIRQVLQCQPRPLGDCFHSTHLSRSMPPDRSQKQTVIRGDRAAAAASPGL